MLNLCGIVVAILKMATARNFWMSGIHSGHHNQCWESIRDIIIYPHMKCRWNRTMLNLCGIVVAILKMETGRNCLCRESIRDIIIYPHIKFWWYQTMLNLCGIVVAILKMATGRNFSMSGINPGHHYLPTYTILMISDNVEFLPPHFLCRVLAAILKMADTLKILKTQNCSSNGDLSLCKIVCLYHYPFRSYQH
jgi:hypothetical protein